MKKYSKYTDKELLEELGKDKASSEAAFTEIYDRYGLRVNAYCRSILGSPEQAEDVFQETFVRFYQKAKSDSKAGSVIGFLITIARNLCLNAKRDAKPTVSIENFEMNFDLNESYESKESANLLTAALELLEDTYKEAMILRYFNGFSYKEIAETLEIKEARARYLVFNGKNKIKKILAPYMNDEYKK